MARTIDTSRKVILPHRLKKYVDLNMDFGQSQEKTVGREPRGTTEDNALLSYVTSVNIPCCVHDGHPREIMRCIELAKENNCAVGAHIAYPDPVNFGYEPMTIDPEELAAWIHVQMGTLRGLLNAHGLEISHVRPHGALYGAFLNDPETAIQVAKTLLQISPWAILVAPVSPVTEQVRQETGIQIAPEICLGKRYSAEGMLIKERFHETMHPHGVLEQARQLIHQGTLTSVDGNQVPVKFKTLHLSSRLENPTYLAEKLYQYLGQPVSLQMTCVGESGWTDA